MSMVGKPEGDGTMVNNAAKAFALVVSAIKNLRELKGSTSREILHYLSSVYNVPAAVARRQMLTALKRGVTYGIIRKHGGHYVLPTSCAMKLQEIAEQEVNLLDTCRRSRLQRKLRCKCKSRRRKRRRRRKKLCKCKSRRSLRRRSRRSRAGCKSRRRRKRKKCRCGGLGSRGDLNRMKRPIGSEPVEQFSGETVHESPSAAYDSSRGEKCSWSDVSSAAE